MPFFEVNRYTHIQDVSSDTWIIPHKLDTLYPVVTTWIDQDGLMVAVVPVDPNAEAPVAPTPITPGFTFTIDNPNVYSTTSNDQFGRAMSMSGDYAAVGVELEDDAGGASSGKVYIIDVTTGLLVRTLDNPNAYSTSSGDSFGTSTDMDGTNLIVGANREADASGTNSGKAYIFDVTTGALLHTLDNPNAYGTSEWDTFASSVAIFGNYAVVGAASEADASGGTAGRAYVFNVTTGALVHTLDNPNAHDIASGDRFGIAVDISDDRILVTADTESDAVSGYSSGKAYVFDLTTGALLLTLDNPDAYVSPGDGFGYDAAMSGDYIIVGTYKENATSTENQSGYVYIFNTYTGALLQTIPNPNPYGTSHYDRFGWKVEIDGNFAIVSAPLEDDAGGAGSGKAYIYDITSAALVHTLDNPNDYGTVVNDGFGNAIAMSGGVVMVGAQGEDDASHDATGKAYIYAFNAAVATPAVMTATMEIVDKDNITMTLPWAAVGAITLV